VKSCDFCEMQWKPLFRIIKTYVRGNACYVSDDCSQEICQTVDCEDYDPQYNRLNITIAIVDGKLMFEDKHGEGIIEDWKQFVDINYCPMCGRSLGAEGSGNA